MKNTKDLIERIAVVAVGVILAGFLLNQLRGNAIADHSRGGFNN